MSSSLRCLFIAAMLLPACAGVATAQVFTTTMTPDQVVPPAPSTASGRGTLALEPNRMLSFDIMIAGLHGSETEASIHGPAPAGANAQVVFRLPLGDTKSGRVGPLTAAQVTELERGLWYVSIHTSHHGSGEIRGQIRGPVGVEPDTWGRVKAQYRSPR